MKIVKLALTTVSMLVTLLSASAQKIDFDQNNLEVVNRKITSISKDKGTLALNRVKGDGMAIINDLKFDKGVIELELQGENLRGKSFIGVAFNIQNDSVYEAIYFRPFNFQAEQKINRDHSVQYIYHPKYTWRYLRTNNEGQYESNFPGQPMPEEWFNVRIEINEKMVIVYDLKTKTKLLSIERLTKQVSDKIGLWTGFDSKGSFRNLVVKDD